MLSMLAQDITDHRGQTALSSTDIDLDESIGRINFRHFCRRKRLHLRRQMFVLVRMIERGLLTMSGSS